ncbi:MAG: aldehyde dehydrogenase family protein [Polyangiaceae bacterium]|nr:aldehyde dehydrogenase family protein [Polyangiaceae bacterium]
MTTQNALPQAEGRAQRTVPCHDPATLEPLGSVAAMDEAAVRAVVRRAREVQPAWGKTSFAERRAVLRAFLDYIVQNQSKICELASRDSGKTMVDAALGEVFPVCEKIRYVLDNGERDLAPEPRGSGWHARRRGSSTRPRGGRRDRALELPLPQHLLPRRAGAVRRQRRGREGLRAHLVVGRAAHRDVAGRLAARGHDPDLLQVVTGFGTRAPRWSAPGSTRSSSPARRKTARR